MYPSICLEFNIAPNTQLGRIIIPQQVFSMENYYKNEKYERAGEYIENLTTDNVIEFSHRWLGLANLIEFLQDWKEYNEKFKSCYSQNGKYEKFYRNDQNKFIEVPVHEVKKTEKPIYELPKGEVSINPIFILTPCVGKEVQYNGFDAGAH